MTTALTGELRPLRPCVRCHVGPGPISAWVIGLDHDRALLDSDGRRLWQQRGLGVAHLVGPAGAAAWASPLVRAQTAVVVVFASVVEYTFSPMLEVYIYRFDNVPTYVPPGHGLVYLAALAIGRTAVVAASTHGDVGGARCRTAARRRTACCSPTGPTCSARSGSCAWWGSWCWGPSRPVYVGAVRRGQRISRWSGPSSAPGPGPRTTRRAGRDRQPAVRRGRRLRLVRPGRRCSLAPLLLQRLEPAQSAGGRSDGVVVLDAVDAL